MVKRDARHNYLGMTLECTTAGVFRVNMMDCVQSMVEGFPQKAQGRNATPWSENPFKVDDSSNQLAQIGKKHSTHL